MEDTTRAAVSPASCLVPAAPLVLDRAYLVPGLPLIELRFSSGTRRTVRLSVALDLSKLDRELPAPVGCFAENWHGELLSALIAAHAEGARR